jgi:dolichol-phosphate mannosyltransferase
MRPIASGLDHYAFEFLFIDDGSTDATAALVRAEATVDPRVKLVQLSRNFGHQRALTAGLDFCTGDYIIILDADLQDPPELIPRILERLEEGFNLVHMVRTDRRVDTAFKRHSAKLFYAVMRRWVLPEMPENAGDFKGFDRNVLNALSHYRERVRFLRGAFATLGFRQTTIPYERAPRAAGVSKYPLVRMLRLARDAVVSNTVLPVRFFLYFGLVLCALVPLYAAGVLAYALANGGVGEPVALFLVGLVTVCTGVILLALGAVGEYLKCIVLEVKRRPLYIVESTANLPLPTLQPGSMFGETARPDAARTDY